jgi:hypothetical protein
MKIIGNETEITMFKELASKNLLDASTDFDAIYFDAEPVKTTVKIL